MQYVDYCDSTNRITPKLMRMLHPCAEIGYRLG